MEVKEVLEALGIEVDITDATTVDEIKTAAGNKFIDKSLLETEKKNAIAGLAKRLGAAETKMKIVFGDEYRDKNFDELVEAMPTVFNSKLEELKKELSEAKKAGNSKEDIKKIEDELNAVRDLLKKTNADLEAERENAKKAIESKEAEFQATIDGIELGGIFDTLNWVDGTSKHTKDGLYINEIQKKYTFKKVDGTYMAYKEDGVTPETGGTTSHLSAVDLFNSILKKENLLKVNGANGTKEVGGAKVDLTGINNPFVKANLEKAMAHAQRQKQK